MSLSISAAPTTSTADGTPAGPGQTKTSPAGLPFDAILEDQTDAADSVDENAGDSVSNLIAGADAPNVSDANVAGTVTRKGKSWNESAPLLLLAIRDLLPQLAAPQPQVAIVSGATVSPGASTFQSDAAVAPLPIGPPFIADTAAALQEVGDQDPEQVPVPMSDVVKALTNAFKATDEATDGSVADALVDQITMPDLKTLRPGVSPNAAVLANAIQIAISHRSFDDQDAGNNPSEMLLGSDRRPTKSLAPLLQVSSDASAKFESTIDHLRAVAAEGPVALPDEERVVSSIVQTMRLQMHEGVGTAVVHLEPDYLGSVSIALRVENGSVTATLHAENAQVRGWMEARESVLRESLAGQGLSLDRLLVTDERIADERSSDRRNQREQDQQARQRPRRDVENTFEVVV